MTPIFPVPSARDFNHIAAAQITCPVGRLAENVEKHKRYTRRAAEAGARVICFSEASLTGYPVSDGVPHEVRSAMLLLLNCGELIPPFMRMGKDIAPDDGWLDVVALHADGIAQSVAAVWDLFRGTANGAGRVWWGRGRTIRVEVVGGGAAPRPVQLDGELVGDTPFETRILAGAHDELELPLLHPLLEQAEPRLLSDVERLVQTTIDRFDRIDLFCSNAGIAVDGGEDTPDAEWRRCWDVNVMGHVHAARAVQSDSEFLSERHGGNSGSPQNIFRVQGFAILQFHAALSDVLYAGVRADLHT